MNLLHRVEHWGDRHHPGWTDIIRIALGIFLCFRGLQFPMNMSTLLAELPPSLSGGPFALIVLGHYIFVAHLLGGILLIFGMYTRIACLIQIPILLGAIIFVNWNKDLFRPFPELIVSLIVLMLLFYFLIAGNGKYTLETITGKEKER